MLVEPGEYFLYFFNKWGSVCGIASTRTLDSICFINVKNQLSVLFQHYD